MHIFLSLITLTFLSIVSHWGLIRLGENVVLSIQIDAVGETSVMHQTGHVQDRKLATLVLS